jgi:hypothetical protein
MITGRDVRIRAAYNHDLMRKAQHERLARQALAGRRKGSAACCRALAWLGRHLAAWGLQLQSRYGGPISSPTQHSADRAVS